MNRSNSPRKHSYLKRLPKEYYKGFACVHWSQTIDDRKTGWLDKLVHAKFREVLLHALARQSIVCPIYCLMPDHMHLVLLGLKPESDQILCIRSFKAGVNRVLEEFGFRLQKQAYDNVLRDEQAFGKNFEDVCEYIARNPERAGLVGLDEYGAYPYSGSLVVGYPTFRFCEPGFWPKFWGVYSRLKQELE